MLWIYTYIGHKIGIVFKMQIVGNVRSTHWVYTQIYVNLSDVFT